MTRSRSIERSQLDQIRSVPNTLAVIYKNSYERAQAQEQMDRAMFITEHVLAVVARMRNALTSAGRVMYQVYAWRAVRNCKGS